VWESCSTEHVIKAAGEGLAPPDRKARVNGLRHLGRFLSHACTYPPVCSLPDRRMAKDLEAHSRRNGAAIGLLHCGESQRTRQAGGRRTSLARRRALAAGMRTMFLESSQPETFLYRFTSNLHMPKTPQRIELQGGNP
jgi:hypothetical protein